MDNLLLHCNCGQRWRRMAASNPANATPQAPPNPPSGVSAAPGNTQITLNWTSVTGATSYNLYWSTTNGVTTSTGAEIGPIASPYTHTGLSNGTTYHYVVTAVNSGGESLPSAQVNTTPGPVVSLLGGSPTGVSGLTNGSGATALFNSPIGITTDGTNVYVSDNANNEIRKIVIATGAVTLFAGSPSGAAGLTNGTATAALFNAPYGMTMNGGNLYVADYTNNEIRKIVLATGVVSLFAGSSTGAPGSTNGTGTAALFFGPQCIATDGTNLYVTDTHNNEIRKIIIATGAVSLLAGSPTGASGLINGTGTAALFNGPMGITTDGTNLYVADYFNHEIRKIVIATGAVSLFAGSSAGLYGQTNGIGAAALFHCPTGITMDGTNLYVVEFSNSDIRKIVIATGEVSIHAGSPTGARGLTNGIGTNALFNYPGEITTDLTNLYITDLGNNEIRELH